jgi:hypothetical protein
MAIYEQAFKHAPASELELLLVERKDKVSQETALGVLLQSSHRVDGLGTPASCMTFISTLEVLGLGSLAVDGIRIDAENGDCQFEVLTVGFE